MKTQPYSSMPPSSWATIGMHRRDRQRLEGDERDRQDEPDGQRATMRRPEAVSRERSGSGCMTHLACRAAGRPPRSSVPGPSRTFVAVGGSRPRDERVARRAAPDRPLGESRSREVARTHDRVGHQGRPGARHGRSPRGRATGPPAGQVRSSAAPSTGRRVEAVDRSPAAPRRGCRLAMRASKTGSCARKTPPASTTSTSRRVRCSAG